MSEHSMWTTARRALKGLDPVRVENPAHPGTPDVNYGGLHNGARLEGWIELKQDDRWPVRPETVLQVPHFTPQQRVWLLRRALAGGRVHLLLKVGVDWLLFTGADAFDLVGRSNRAALMRGAVGYWRGSIIETEFKTCIQTTS